jgi:hypothetical protein
MIGYVFASVHAASLYAYTFEDTSCPFREGNSYDTNTSLSPPYSFNSCLISWVIFACVFLRSRYLLSIRWLVRRHLPKKIAVHGIIHAQGLPGLRHNEDTTTDNDDFGDATESDGSGHPSHHAFMKLTISMVVCLALLS